jgi:AcrR family transcriptional regulator
VRQSILDAARHLFIKGGYGNVPIRQISSHIGYSAAALYRYFPTKDDIFNALAEEGLQLLMRSETSPSPPGASPLRRLRHVISGAFDFAKRYPEYYYLLFLDRSTPRMKLESLDAFREPMRPHLREILDDCVEAGELASGLDTWTVYNVIWTSMHGVAAQYVCDRFPPFDPDEYARVMVDLVIAGLKAGTLNGVRLFDMADGEMSPAARKKWLAAGRKKR